MGLARRLRGTIDRAAHATGVLGLLERGMGRGLTILTYHRVLPRERAAEYPFPALALPSAAFESQVRHLCATCTVLPLGAALAALARPARDGRPLVALTFDDGYEDNARIAAPILERSGVRGTFFVATAFVAGREPLWYDRAAAAWDRAAPAARAAALRALDPGASEDGAERVPDALTFVERLKPRPPAERAALVDELDGGRMADAARALVAPMGPDALRALHEAGHEIGSHSVHHPVLTRLDDRALAREIGDARAELEAWIGAPPAAFCYPNGDLDERVVAAVRAAGHASACTTRSGRNAAGCDPFRLRRVDVTARRTCGDDLLHDALAFRGELCGLHARLRGDRSAP